MDYRYNEATGLYDIIEDGQIVKSVRTELAAIRSTGGNRAVLIKAEEGMGPTDKPAGGKDSDKDGDGKVDRHAPDKGAKVEESGQDKGDDGDHDDPKRGMQETATKKSEDPDEDDDDGEPEEGEVEKAAGTYSPDYGQRVSATASYAAQGPGTAMAGIDALMGASPMNANPRAIADYGQFANATASYAEQVPGAKGTPSPTQGADPSMPAGRAPDMAPQTHRVAYGQTEQATASYAAQKPMGGVQSMPTTVIDANGGAAVGAPAGGSGAPRPGSGAAGFEQHTAGASTAADVMGEGTDGFDASGRGMAAGMYSGDRAGTSTVTAESGYQTALQQYGGSGGGGAPVVPDDVPVGHRTNPSGPGDHGGMVGIKKALDAAVQRHPWLAKAAVMYDAATTDDERDRLTREVMKALAHDAAAEEHGTTGAVTEIEAPEVVQKAEVPEDIGNLSEDAKLALLVKGLGTQFAQGDQSLGAPRYGVAIPQAPDATRFGWDMDDEVEKSMQAPVDSSVGLDFINADGDV